MMILKQLQSSVKSYYILNLTVYKSSMVSKIATVKKDKRGKIVHFVYKDQVLPNLPGLFDENCLFFFL